MAAVVPSPGSAGATGGPGVTPPWGHGTRYGVQPRRWPGTRYGGQPRRWPGTRYGSQPRRWPDTRYGVQPSWLPEMVWPAATPEPVKFDSWRDTDQPGREVRRSVTVMSSSVPCAATRFGALRITVPGVMVTVKAPCRGTVTVMGTVFPPPCAARGFTISEQRPAEPA